MEGDLRWFWFDLKLLLFQQCLLLLAMFETDTKKMWSHYKICGEKSTKINFKNLNKYRNKPQLLKYVINSMYFKKKTM